MLDYDAESCTLSLSDRSYTVSEIFKIYATVFDTLNDINKNGYIKSESFLHIFIPLMNDHLEN
jgi:hypothetical protein